MTREHDSTAPPTAPLGVWDGISVIIGIVVGVTIFRAPADIFGNVREPWQAFALWGLGGGLALIGALCYAELATTYPRSGGDYVYLTRAFGPLVGFLFGWAHLAGILTGSIGAMAYVFGDYAVALLGQEASLAAWYAVAIVVVLSALNVLGVVVGKSAQNVLSGAKVLGLTLIIIAGLWPGGAPAEASASVDTGPVNPWLAFIFVMYAYGGWNDTAFVAAEIRDRRRNLPLVLVLGTAAIIAIYLLANLAYLNGLGPATVRVAATPAADVLRPWLGEWGARGMSLLVMVSAMGAINGLVFTGSRVHASLGADHRLFAPLGKWHPRLGTPVASLVTQAVVTIVMIIAVGTPAGRGALDAILRLAGRPGLPWQDYGGGFGTLVGATAPVFWLFFLLTGVAFFVLRVRDAGRERPFRVPLYPVLPLVFCVTCGVMLYSSLAYAGELAALALVPLALGVPLYLLSRVQLSRAQASERRDPPSAA